MVTRKASLPYPTPSLSTNLVVDSADLPPVPSMQSRGHPESKPAVLMDEHNPWNDAPSSPQLRSDRPLPDVLKPRNGKPVEQTDTTPNTTASHVPDEAPLRSGPNTPRSSIDSDRSKDFWEEDDDDLDEQDKTGRRSPQRPVNNQTTSPMRTTAYNSAADPAVKRKPVSTNGPATRFECQPLPPDQQFASNNPFRRVSASESPPRLNPYPTDDLPHWDDEPSAASRVKGKDVDHGSQNHSPPTAQLARANINSSAMPDLSSYSASQAQVNATQQWQQHDIKQIIPPAPFEPPPPPPPSSQKQQYLAPPSEQPPLIPVLADHTQSPNPWDAQPKLSPTPSPIPFDSSQKYVSDYNNSLLDRGQETGVISLADELADLPDYPSQPASSIYSQPSLLDNDESGPQLPQRPGPSKLKEQEGEYYDPPEGPPPAKPPRLSVKTSVPSDAEIARIAEQRNETYQIKHFNWFDHGSGKLRRSSMLTQNKNGPCPLLALVNALILGAKDESQATLDEALRSREQVTLGLIIETLMDELLTRGYSGGSEVLPDVDELNGFLMRLRTGMNANPRFVAPTTPAPNLMDARNSMLHLPQAQRARQKAGTFEATSDLKLYGAFSVPLVHGWLPEHDSGAARAFARSAQTYEDAQALQFGEEELEYKLSRGGLTTDEEQMWGDINSIKNFLKQYPTQLTPHGLESVQDVLSSGSFAIMFRNDHFSTIYKHPQSGQLFTLITDAGYADRDEIIWESLVDISGKHSEFFSGDFMPVGHNQSQPPASSTDYSSAQNLAADQLHNAPLSPQEQQEQHDADFAMALQLQEEEEQHRRAEQARRRSQNNSSSNTNTSGGRNRNTSSGNIPISLRRGQESRNNSDDISNRPLIPPRTSRSHIPSTSRPADALDDDAPPAYEEAAKGKPYIPPLGSPLHPSSDPSGSTPNLLTPLNSNQAGGSSNSNNPRYSPSATQMNVNSNNNNNVNTGTGTQGGGGGGGRGPSMPNRCMSAYNEQSYGGYYGQNSSPTTATDPRRSHERMPGGYGQRPSRMMPGGQQQQQQQQQQQSGGDRDRDCVVM